MKSEKRDLPGSQLEHNLLVVFTVSPIKIKISFSMFLIYLPIRENYGL